MNQKKEKKNENNSSKSQSSSDNDILGNVNRVEEEGSLAHQLNNFYDFTDKKTDIDIKNDKNDNDMIIKDSGDNNIINLINNDNIQNKSKF